MNINSMSKEELFEKFTEWLESQDNGSETETHLYYCPVHVTTSAAYNIAEVAQLHIGDVISFTTSDDDHIEAVAVRRDGDNMLFVTVDCLKDRFCMNSSSGNDSYYGMIAHLNDVYDTFPDNLKDVMVSLPNGDMLRLLTAGEVFGKDIEKYEYSDDEPDQIQYFIKRRNRIAMDATDDTEWWWLSNRVKNSSAHFAGVNHGGYASCDYASGASGVRPAFYLKAQLA